LAIDIPVPALFKSRAVDLSSRPPFCKADFTKYFPGLPFDDQAEMAL
jgi:hypothetical protein